MPGAEDHELVSNALRGDQRAYREIVERYHSMAYAAIRAVTGERDEIEDILQDVFVKVYRGLEQFRGDSKLSTWIFRIARNEAINHVARIVPDTIPVESVDIQAPPGGNPESEFEKRQLREHLEQALSHLDAEQRMAIELRYLGERSYQEIAESMDIPLGTVKTHIFRGKVELRKVMGKLLRPQKRGDR